MRQVKPGDLIKKTLEMEVINIYVVKKIKIIIVVYQNVYPEKIIVKHI